MIEAAFGHRTYYMCAKDDSGRICGVLPLVRQTSRLFGDNLTSLPFLNYGGAVGDSEDIENVLMQSAGEFAQAAGISHVEFRDDRPRNGEWPVSTRKVSMRLELPDTPEALGKSIGSKLRSQTRRSAKEGVVLETGSVELLPDFYQVLSRTWRDLGTPLYSRLFFEEICRQFADDVVIVVARLNSAPIAAGFLIGFDESIEIPWAGAIRDYNRISVNMALYWQALTHAIEKGYRVFDFGRSTTDSGTYRFKRQWGAEPVQLHWHYWLPNGADLPDLNPSNPKYDMAIRVWQKLPLAVTSRLGPPVSKFLP